MRKIMVFQHVAHEPLGTLNPMLKQAGFRIRYVNFGRDTEQVPSLDGYNGLIVLGGPMGVYEADRYGHLLAEQRALESALQRGIPVLGICLGAQLLAATLGARVSKGPTPEFGWYDVHPTPAAAEDPLFAGWSAKERIFQLHQDTFELPAGAVHLATSDLYPGQAFRYGSNAYGLQFHLEVDEPMIRRWMTIPTNRGFLREGGGAFDAHATLTDTQACIARSLELSAATFDAFIKIFQLPQRGELLGSGHGKPRKLE